MPTSTLTAAAAFTPANATQPTYSSPPDTLPLASTVANYSASELTLEGLSAAGHASTTTLPIPTSWDEVTQVLVQNVDTTNSCLILLNGESTVVSVEFAGNVVLAQSFSIVVNGATVGAYTAVASAPTAVQFVRGGSLAVSLANLYAAIGANLPAGIRSVQSNGVDTLYFSASLPTTTAGTWSSTATTSATTAYQLLAPGQVFAASFTAATDTAIASYTALDPRLFTLVSCDASGDIGADVTCQVYCYCAGS